MTFNQTNNNAGDVKNIRVCGSQPHQHAWLANPAVRELADCTCGAKAVHCPRCRGTGEPPFDEDTGRQTCEVCEGRGVFEIVEQGGER